MRIPELSQYQLVDTDTSSGNSVADFLRILFKRKHAIAAFFLATVATVVVASFFFLKTVYRADAQVLIQLGREHLTDVSIPTRNSVRPVVSFNQAEQIALATELLHGRQLLEHVIDDLGIDEIYGSTQGWFKFGKPDTRSTVERIVNRLREEIIIRPVSNSSLLKISYEHKDPEVAAKVINTLITLYVDRHLKIRQDTQRDEFFQEQFGTLETKLDTSEDQLRQLKKDNEISSSVVEEKTALLAQVTDLTASALEADIAKRETAQRIEALTNQLSNTTQDPQALATLRERLLELELKEKKLLVTFDEESRLVANAKQEIRAVKRALSLAGGKKLYGSVSSAQGSLFERLQEEFLNQTVELSALEIKTDAQQAQLEAYQNRLAVLDQVESEFARLDQQIKVDRENYRLYLTKFEESRISEAMDKEGIASVKVVESAVAPTQPVEGKRFMALMVAVFAGAVGGIGFAFLLELLAGTVDTRRQVERHLGVPVLALIPESDLTEEFG